jgi:Nucleotidyl transferase of unknown function (DUF2204)
MIAKQVFDAIGPVIEILDRLGIPYLIGGSVASSAYGIYRATADIDIVIDLKLVHIEQLAEQLEAEYYIDAEMLKDTLAHRSSCNIIYLPTMTKIDIFIPKEQEFDLQQFQHARREEFEIEGNTRIFNLASPEDLILRKLMWYRQGGSTSERQWLDVLGVLKVQAQSLDMAYMQDWAWKLGVTDLLERALEDAGLPPLEDIEF